MSLTKEQTQEQKEKGRIYNVKGIASFPFIVTVEAGDEEDAASIVQGIELMDLLLGLEEDEYDEVRIKEVEEVED